MNSQFAFADDIIFSTQSAADELLNCVTPVITEIGKGLDEGQSLSELICSAAEKYSFLTDYFDVSLDENSPQLLLKKSYVYMDSTVSSVQLFNKATGKGVTLASGVNESKDMLNLIGGIERGQNIEELSRQPYYSKVSSILEPLIRGKILVPIDKKESRPDMDQPGIYRLQHASLLYRTKSTAIISDPHFHSVCTPKELNTTYTIRNLPKIDAVLISHSHSDHFDITSLMMFPRETIIIVPKVIRSTLICDNLEARLKELEFTNVIAVDWYSAPIKIGDIEIHVLPFYGEQPLLSERPHHEDVWNWGNTYVVRTPDSTSWFLIDSGEDARGKMSEVAEAVLREIGKIDIVLSNLRQFNVMNPFYVNNGRNWLTLSTDQKQRLPLMKSDCLTLGPSGVAKVCKIVGSKTFLPYAHWWSDIGTTPPGEPAMLQKIKNALNRFEGTTQVLSWNIGDRFLKTVEQTTPKN